jgi:hypothetical protein
LIAGIVLLCAAALPAAAFAAPLAAWSPASYLSALVDETRLTANDGAAGDQLGWSVALDGDTAVVGAPYADVGGQAGQGAVYVFVRSGGVWKQQARLTAAAGAAGDAFGRAVALDGDTVLVGAPFFAAGANADQGAAFVFERSGTVWSERAMLAADGASANGFGSSVALDGGTALVGDPSRSDVLQNAGAVFVYVGSGATWSLQGVLTAADAAPHDLLGTSVALDGDTALAGAVGDNAGTAADRGAAYVFRRSGATWAQQAQLVAPDAVASARVGDAVALAGDTALAGAPFDQVGGHRNQGSVYVFARSGSVWSPQARLVETGGDADDGFGSSLAMVDDTALIGVQNDGDSLADGGQGMGRGSVVVYGRAAGAWVQKAKLTPADPAVNDHFGSSVSLDGDTALIGAYGDNVAGRADQGSATVLAGGPPVTTATLKPAPTVYGWNRTDVTVTLSAKDLFSGVATTEYRASGAAGWTPYAAPFRVTASGSSQYDYRSTDLDGRAEAAKKLTVRIDKVRPVTRALADARVASGKKVTLRLRADDPVSPKWWGFIRILKGSRLEEKLNVPLQRTNTEVRYPFTCTLPPGRYTWKVDAVDLAGNRQSKAEAGVLVVL